MMRMRSQIMRMRIMLKLRMRIIWLRMRIINLEELFWKLGAKLAKKMNLYPLVPITKT